MPTYQYSCTECGHFLEQFQSFTDDALTECPECGGKLRKVFNAVGVVFKGSGFYRNDSRSGAKDPTPVAKDSTEGQKDGQKDAQAGTPATNGSSSNGSEKAPATTPASGSSSDKSSSGSAKSTSTTP